MKHTLQRILRLSFVVLVLTNSAAAQVTMPHGDAQRSRVFATSGLSAPPSRVVWQLDNLFHLKFTEDFVLKNGPFTLRGELPTFQSLTAPIVSDGVIFFTIYVDTGYFYAVDAGTGKQIVTLKFDDTGLSAPVAMGQTAFFATRRGKLYAYDVKTRSSKWTFEQKDASFAEAEPVVDDGVIYLCSYESGVFAIAANNGALKWQFKTDRPLAGPAVQGEHVVVLSNKALIALDTKSGTKKWEQDIGRDFYGPSILGDQIFVRHIDGEVRAYGLQDGALKWKSKIEGGARTPLALYDGSVFYGEQYGNLVALDARTGLEKWRFQTKKHCSGPRVAGATVYTSCDDHYLYALDAATGALKWKAGTKGSGPTPIMANGVGYSLSSDGHLQAIQ